MRKKWIAFCLLILICGCKKQVPEQVRAALQISGENRSELEKVLKHYALFPADSLKLKAAEFLIGNMPGHLNYTGEALDRYYNALDSIMQLRLLPAEMAQEVTLADQAYKESIELSEDVKNISATYLIQNIEAAFDVWQEKGWAQHLSFEQFCEYILPYKVLHKQQLDNWRAFFKDRFEIEEDLFTYCTPMRNSSYQACIYLNEALRKNVKTKQWLPEGFSVMSPVRLLNMSRDVCDNHTFMAAALMRSHGVPVAIDFTPCWGNKSTGHSWNVLVAAKNKYIPFEGLHGNPEGMVRPDEKLGKVYRYTYAVNKELENLQKQVPEIPEPFTNPFMKDVTDEYIDCADIRIPVQAALKRKDKTAWLTHFSIHGWSPVGWGKVKNGAALFRNAGKNALYLSGYYRDEKIEPLNYPFIIDFRGKVNYLKPDKEKTTDLTLIRKYSTNKNTYDAAKKLIGGRFEASNQEDFTDSVTICIINEWAHMGEFVITDTTSYRYWRYVSSDAGHCNLAELWFYDGDGYELSGKVTGTEGSNKSHPGRTKEAVFDRDPFTYFDAVEPGGSWVGMDFNTPVSLSRIVWLPRNDDNTIRIGDMYELFYWDLHGWVSMGRKQAEELHLIYEGAPSNALFWLRNLTRGTEERPFTYENGKQVFW